MGKAKGKKTSSTYRKRKAPTKKRATKTIVKDFEGLPNVSPLRQPSKSKRNPPKPNSVPSPIPERWSLRTRNIPPSPADTTSSVSSSPTYSSLSRRGINPNTSPVERVEYDDDVIGGQDQDQHLVTLEGDEIPILESNEAPEFILNDNQAEADTQPLQPSTSKTRHVKANDAENISTDSVDVELISYENFQPEALSNLMWSSIISRDKTIRIIEDLNAIIKMKERKFRKTITKEILSRAGLCMQLERLNDELNARVRPMQKELEELRKLRTEDQLDLDLKQIDAVTTRMLKYQRSVNPHTNGIENQTRAMAFESKLKTSDQLIGKLRARIRALDKDKASNEEVLVSDGELMADPRKAELRTAPNVVDVEVMSNESADDADINDLTADSAEDDEMNGPADCQDEIAYSSPDEHTDIPNEEVAEAMEFDVGFEPDDGGPADYEGHKWADEEETEETMGQESPQLFLVSENPSAAKVAGNEEELLDLDVENTSTNEQEQGPRKPMVVRSGPHGTLSCSDIDTAGSHDEGSQPGLTVSMNTANEALTKILEKTGCRALSLSEFEGDVTGSQNDEYSDDGAGNVLQMLEMKGDAAFFSPAVETTSQQNEYVDVETVSPVTVTAKHVGKHAQPGTRWKVPLSDLGGNSSTSDTGGARKRKGMTAYTSQYDASSRNKGMTAHSSEKKGKTANTSESDVAKKRMTAHTSEKKGNTANASVFDATKKGMSSYTSEKKGQTANTSESDAAKKKGMSSYTSEKKGQTANTSESDAAKKKGMSAHTSKSGNASQKLKSFSTSESDNAVNKKGITAKTSEIQGKTANTSVKKGKTVNTSESDAASKKTGRTFHISKTGTVNKEGKHASNSESDTASKRKGKIPAVEEAGQAVIGMGEFGGGKKPPQFKVPPMRKKPASGSDTDFGKRKDFQAPPPPPVRLPCSFDASKKRPSIASAAGLVKSESSNSESEVKPKKATGNVKNNKVSFLPAPRKPGRGSLKVLGSSASESEPERPAKVSKKLRGSGPTTKGNPPGSPMEFGPMPNWNTPYSALSGPSFMPSVYNPFSMMMPGPGMGMMGNSSMFRQPLPNYTNPGQQAQFGIPPLSPQGSQQQQFVIPPPSPESRQQQFGIPPSSPGRPQQQFGIPPSNPAPFGSGMPSSYQQQQGGGGAFPGVGQGDPNNFQPGMNAYYQQQGMNPMMDPNYQRMNMMMNQTYQAGMSPMGFPQGTGAEGLRYQQPFQQQGPSPRKGSKAKKNQTPVGGLPAAKPTVLPTITEPKSTDYSSDEEDGTRGG